ncbi:MAG: ribose 5-phosphate isomerase B [Proteobacteria bacterium]|nr:ribose 5-phosphate isomerase B [Pseudomonadota bacterium]
MTNPVTKDIIAIASDHAGFELKSAIKDALIERGFEVLDLGTGNGDSVDYPDFGHAMGAAIDAGEAPRGVIVCGSGIGISIAANRHKGVRAALCTSGLMARLARQHNDANVLALGARIIGFETAMDCLNAFLDTDFEGGRHARRAEKI